MKDLKSIGLFLLGTGVLILSLIALHFYVTMILPSKEQGPSLTAFCNAEGNTAIVSINTFRDVSNVEVYVDSSLLCSYDVLPAGSKIVCKGGGKINATFKIEYVENGKKKIYEDVCRRILRPLPVE